MNRVGNKPKKKKSEHLVVSGFTGLVSLRKAENVGIIKEVD